MKRKIFILILILFVYIAVVVANPIISSWRISQEDTTRLWLNENGTSYLNGTMIIESLIGSYTNGEAYLCVDGDGLMFAKDTVCS